MTETKVCFKCGRDLPLAQFWKMGKRDGVQKYRPSCKQCEALARDIRASKRQPPTNEPDRACVVCGQVKPAEAFYWRNDNGQRRRDCKSCASAHVRARYHADMKDPAYRELRHAQANARNRRRWYASVMQVREERR